MDENEFEVGGVIYVAKPAKLNVAHNMVGCDGCAIEYSICSDGPRPQCNKIYRTDARDVIFVEKHP